MYVGPEVIAGAAVTIKAHAEGALKEGNERIRRKLSETATEIHRRLNQESGEKNQDQGEDEHHGRENNVPDAGEKELYTRQRFSSSSSSSTIPSDETILTGAEETSAREGLRHRQGYTLEDEERIQEEHSHLSAMEQENERRRIQLERENEILRQEEAILEERKRSFQQDSDSFASQSLRLLSPLHSSSTSLSTASPIDHSHTEEEDLPSHTSLDDPVSLTTDTVLFDASSTILQEDKDFEEEEHMAHSGLHVPHRQHVYANEDEERALLDTERASTISDPESWIDVDHSSSSSLSTNSSSSSHVVMKE